MLILTASGGSAYLSASGGSAYLSASGGPAYLSASGGTGKTQLAAALAHQLWDSRAVDLLVWVKASTRNAILTGYALTLAELGAADPGDDLLTGAQRFLAWLSRTERRWLVVLDDLADPADLEGLWPAGTDGRVVVTARRDGTLAAPNRRIAPGPGVQHPGSPGLPERPARHRPGPADRGPRPGARPGLPAARAGARHGRADLHRGQLPRLPGLVPRPGAADERQRAARRRPGQARLGRYRAAQPGTRLARAWITPRSASPA